MRYEVRPGEIPDLVDLPTVARLAGRTPAEVFEAVRSGSFPSLGFYAGTLLFAPALGRPPRVRNLFHTHPAHAGSAHAHFPHTQG